MELMGALSNRENHEKLARLNALRRDLLEDAPEKAPVTSRPQAGAGAILKAICAVLDESGEVMEVSAIREAVEHCLQRPVNPGSVKACLSEGSLATPARFKRTGYGCYRLI